MTAYETIPELDDLREPAALYELLAQHTTDLLSVHDATGKQLWASRSLERLLGPGAIPSECILPEDRDAYAHWWRQVLDGSAERLRLRIRSAAGHVRSLETSAAVLRYRDRPYVVCSARDITRQKQADDALRESELMLRAAAHQAHVAYWEDDFVAARVRWSDEGCSISDVSPKQLSMTWDEWIQLVHPDDRSIADHRAAAMRGDASSARQMFRMLRRNGTVRYVETHVEIIRDDRGRPIRAVGALQDVTEREQAAKALRASEENLRLALQATGLGTWEWDLRTNTVAFSDEWKRQLGYAPNEIGGRYEEFESRLHPDEREQVLTALRDYMEGRQPEYAMELRMRHKDGSYRWIDTRGVVLRDSSGERTHMLGSHLDVTERMQLDEQLRQAQKMEAVGRLAAGIAHDFNNLLTVIGGNSELVAEALGPLHPSRPDIGDIQAAARSAASLTRQLLAFSRREIIQPQVIDVNKVLRRVQLMLGRVIGEHITLTMNLTAVGCVSADPGQIEQVIMNLAVNARDAMPDGGRLVIETSDVDLDDAYVAQHREATTGRHVRVAVSDTGSGMDESTRAHLFEPFFTTKGSGRGTGLGLATVYGIVKQNGGSIWVDSAPGRGSTFKVYLPISTDAAELAPPPAEMHALRGTETVLVVEDQPDVRGLIERTLRKYGYRLLTAATGPEAVAVARAFEGEIHVLLTDVILPGMNGRETAHQVVVARPAVRVLYMSGYTDDAIAHHGVLEPGLAFLQKPFSGDALARRIREVLATEAPPLI